MKKVDIGKVHAILTREARHYDVPVIDLIKVQTGDPYRILVGTILSARTKDETTAVACATLFKKAKTMRGLAKLTVKEIETLIYPVGFYRNKAKHLHALPGVLAETFDSVIPRTVDELVQLPGVGRKTANLVSSSAFEEDAICVDIHVHRIMNRMGYLRTSSPHETEMTLRKKLPKKYWRTVNTLWVRFGQKLCRPVSPHCSQCPVYDHCNRVGVKQSR